MKSKTQVLQTAIILAMLVLSCALNGYSQCYLSQGCKPEDNLTYAPNGTGQVYHGDGASNNGTGGWTTYYSDVNQCLSCHYGTDTYPYLMTGHKNALRKLAPGTLWGGPDGAAYSAGDPYYGSDSTFNWSTNQITVGACLQPGVPAQNGLPALDPACQYLLYGSTQNMSYVFGGWQNYSKTQPNVTQLNTIYNGGFTGELYPNGTFDCGRCHATGYNFDNSAPEPTSNANGKLTWIPPSQLSRLPSDGFVAPGTSGTSSWYLTGIQCERCHVAAYGSGSHPWNSWVQPTIARNETATALCMECHRQENITMTVNGNPGSINPANTLQVFDKGYCSDLSGSNYSTCVANSSNQWIYKPYLKYAEGQSFLNSPHAQFTGTLAQNAQHSPDLSIKISGTYASYFTDATDPSKNGGCTRCHDPHQSTVAAVNAPQPIVKGGQCSDCHQLAQNILQTTIHPAGPGTPFPTGTQADIPGACVNCHMQGALGQPSSHLFRINADANYFTFPTADQFWINKVTAPNAAPAFSPYSGSVYPNATWLDVDLACGQCHVGGDGKTNPYGLTMPPGMPGSHAYTRQQLAFWASVMHAPDPGVPTPTFTPTPGTYTTPQTITISDSMSGATIYYTMDGSLPTPSSPVYSLPITISATTTFKAMAGKAGIPYSGIAMATFTINLPTAPSPTFSPIPTTYSSPQSVTLSNSAGLAMYFTTDGSAPTTSSTKYSGPISVAQNTTIKAIAAGYGYMNSAISTGTYSIQAPTPTFSPGTGSYSTAQNVTISDSASTATLYYTTNGATPTTSSTPCANPCTMTISVTTTLKAIASGGGYVSSNVGVASYTFTAASPVFSPAQGTFYSSPLTITITDSTPGVTIYYSLTGFPTTSSPSCSSPCTVSISSTTTLRAMATGNGLSQSGTTVGTYTIQAATPTLSPASGTYNKPLSVTISDTSPGVTIYYALNGFPSTGSPSCSSPCTVTLSTADTTTIRAMAQGGNYSQSGTGFATYTTQ